MSPAPHLPREHLTITPRKGPMTKEGIEHLAEEERTSRSQTTTDDEDEELPKLLSPDETLSLVGARLRAAGREGGGVRGGKTRTEKRDRSNTGNRSNSELKEICEEPESELDDFDVEASPRQNRLNMGASPSCARRNRRNRPDCRDLDSSSSPTSQNAQNSLGQSDHFFSSTLSTASSDSESSESRRTSSRDLSIYAAQLRNLRERRDRDSSDERDSRRNSRGNAKESQSQNNRENSSKTDSQADSNPQNKSTNQNPDSAKTRRKIRKKRMDHRSSRQKNRNDFTLDSIAEKSDSGVLSLKDNRLVAKKLSFSTSCEPEVMSHSLADREQPERTSPLDQLVPLCPGFQKRSPSTPIKL